MRVLVVDDKEENLYYLSALLTGAGYEVETARHGAEALAIGRRTPPSVVISDLLMPVMDGYTLLRHWKADAVLQHAPFIVYTATYTEPADEQLAMSLGADAFILKPAEPDDFLARLHAIEANAATATPARPATPATNPGPPGAEDGLLREYSEILIRKLEEKTLQLEDSNRSLLADIAARKLAEAALRESESNFRLLTEAMPQLVWITGADGGNIFFNQRWVEFTGMTLAESAGQGWLRPFHPDDRPHAETAWKAAIATGETYSLEARLGRADGAYRWWLVRALPLHDEAGAIVRWFGTCTDIEDLKQAAATLHATEEQLRQAQKMEAIGRLAGGIAHDFNNLLSVILGYAELVVDTLPADEPVREDVIEIRRSGERAAELTRQLLAFSRQQVLRPKVVDLGLVVIGMANLLRRILGEDVALSLPHGSHRGRIFADPGQIEQVVLNLAVNARDAMPAGGTLTIEIEDQDLDEAYAADHPDVAAGPHVMLAVTDTGAGMDAATQERIFEPFFTTKEVGKGTGLGLSTVFGVVKQSRGHIHVCSELGIGTTFKLYFPATELVAGPEESADAPRVELKGFETILLVEDDTQVRELNRTVLRRNGYTVIDAPNGREALEASARSTARIHLLLTDVVMPLMSGRELAERIVVDRPDVKVLYVSGYAEDAIVHHGMLDPGIAFLAKPIAPESLLRAVREVLAAPD